MKGIRNGVSIFLSTGYCIGTVTAMFLNMILPADPEDDDEEEDEGEDDLSTQKKEGVMVAEKVEVAPAATAYVTKEADVYEEEPEEMA